MHLRCLIVAFAACMIAKTKNVQETSNSSFERLYPTSPNIHREILEFYMTMHIGPMSPRANMECRVDLPGNVAAATF